MTHRNAPHMYKSFSVIAAGVLLLGLLGACTEVQVAVDTCGNKGPIVEPRPAGGCNTPNPITVDTAATTFSAYDAQSKQKITNSSLMCLAGGNSSNGGNCGFTPCRTWYYSQSATTGICTASCNP